MFSYYHLPILYIWLLVLNNLAPCIVIPIDPQDTPQTFQAPLLQAFSRLIKVAVSSPSLSTFQPSFLVQKFDSHIHSLSPNPMFIAYTFIMYLHNLFI